jgi:PemK-like, MazF-like toxin of type II toxin-antitoxin system
MGTPSIGSVVLVNFPFSDLSSSKRRPAVVLAAAGQNDWILCQITSNQYSDKHAVEISPSDFSSGSLIKISYARPGKLFCANNSIIHRTVGQLHQSKLDIIIKSIIQILQPAS